MFVVCLFFDSLVAMINVLWDMVLLNVLKTWKRSLKLVKTYTFLLKTYTYTINHTKTYTIHKPNIYHKHILKTYTLLGSWIFIRYAYCLRWYFNDCFHNFLLQTLYPFRSLICFLCDWFHLNRIHAIKNILLKKYLTDSK